jgi:hypothetical protein
MAPHTAAIETFVDGLDAETRSAILARLLQGQGEAVVLTRAELNNVDDLGEWMHIVPQWTLPDGKQRGARIRALTFRDRKLSEDAAMEIAAKNGRPGQPDAWMLMAQEVMRGMVEPRISTVDTILDWNDEVVTALHAAILRLGKQIPARLRDELAALAGGPAPEPAPASATRQRHSTPPGVAGKRRGAAKAPAREPDPPTG